MMGDLKLFIEFLQRSRYNSIGSKEIVEIENCKEVESYGRGTIAKNIWLRRVLRLAGPVKYLYGKAGYR